MISIDYNTRVISVPQADMTLVQTSPFEIRELNIDTFRLALKDLEDDPDGGIAFPDTHRHNPPVSIGGVSLAEVVELINNYTVTFGNGSYAVNIVGGNSNIGDRANLNSVSIRSANSAGLIVTAGGSGASAAEVWAYSVRQLTNQQLTPAQIALLDDLVKIHGLVLGSPLAVAPATRTAGGITQTISTVGDTTTVARA